MKREQGVQWLLSACLGQEQGPGVFWFRSPGSFADLPNPQPLLGVSCAYLLARLPLATEIYPRLTPTCPWSDPLPTV